MNYSKRLFSIFIALGMIASSGNHAHASGDTELIAEPPTILFGKIFNRTANSEVLNEGQLTVQIELDGAAPVSMTTQLFDYANGEYSYVLEIPHQASSFGLEANEQYLPLQGATSTLSLNSIEVDSYPASVVAPGTSTIELSQAERGQVLRLDLEVFLPMQDFDGDGIPDWWEDANGLDKQSAGDASSDADGDGLDALGEYRGGTDPNRSDLTPSVLTSELVAYAGGTSIMLLQSADLDTVPESLTYQFATLPASGTLARWNPESRDLTNLEVGAQMTQAEVDEGLLRFSIEPAISDSVQNFSVALSDGNAAYAATSADIDIHVNGGFDAEAASTPLEAIRAQLVEDVASGAIALDLGRATTASRIDLSGDSETVLPESEPLGSPFDFVLISGSASVELTGSALNDFVVASQAAEGYYAGGVGSDTFYFLAAREQQTVEDFSALDGDVLDISGLLDGASGDLLDYVGLTLVGGDTQMNVYAEGDQTAFPDLTVILRNLQMTQDDLVDLYYGGQLLAGDVGLNPRISIVAGDDAAETGESGGSFLLTREGDFSSELSANIAISGTALNGVDYRSIQTSVIFAANESESTIAVSPFADGISEPTEKVIVTLTANESYALSDSFSAEIDILDQLPELTLEVMVAKAVASPTQPGVLLLKRTAVMDVPLFVQLEISGTASNGLDYTYVSPYVNLAAYESTKAIEFIPSPDLASLSENFVKSILVSIKDGSSYDVTGEGQRLYLVKEQMTFAEWRISRDGVIQSTSLDYDLTSGSTDLDPLRIQYALAGDLNSDPEPGDLVPSLKLVDDHIEVSYRRNLLATDVTATLQYRLPDGDWVDAGGEFVPSNEEGADPSIMVYRSTMKYSDHDSMMIRIRIDINE